jgi:hypothetical protein
MTENDDSAWPQLHDATLLGLNLRWKEALVEVELLIGGDRSGTWLLAGENVRGVICPREEPWGPSVSVNEVRGPLLRKDGYQSIELELQSGDTLIVHAKRFTLRRS